jgi:hypothetical protein
MWLRTIFLKNFLRKVSQCSPGWPVAQDPLASTMGVLGLQNCAAMPIDYSVSSFVPGLDTYILCTYSLDFLTKCAYCVIEITYRICDLSQQSVGNGFNGSKDISLTLNDFLY